MKGDEAVVDAAVGMRRRRVYAHHSSKASPSSRSQERSSRWHLLEEYRCHVAAGVSSESLACKPS